MIRGIATPSALRSAIAGASRARSNCLMVDQRPDAKLIHAALVSRAKQIGNWPHESMKYSMTDRARAVPTAQCGIDQYHDRETRS